MLYKGAAVAGGIGTVGGVTGVAVLANKDSANFEQVKKQVEDKTKTDLESFIKSFGINKEEEKGIIEAIKDKTKDFLKDGKADISKIVSYVEGFGKSKIDSADEKNIEDKLKQKFKGKIKDREEIKKSDLKVVLSELAKVKEKLTDLKIEENKKENNLCWVVQKELFKKLAESNFELEFEEKTNEEGLPTLIKACLTKKKA